jgi:hypothetical protein
VIVEGAGDRATGSLTLDVTCTDQRDALCRAVAMQLFAMLASDAKLAAQLAKARADLGQ